MKKDYVMNKSEKIIQTNGLNRLGSNIKKYRIAKGLKQVDIIREMQLRGVPTNSFSMTRLEQGKINPTLDFLIAFVDIVEIDFNTLFSFDEA